jgi:hypothetical protein
MTAMTELTVASWRMVSTGTVISDNYYSISSVKDLENSLEEIKSAKQSLSKAEQQIKRTIQKAEV